MIGYEPRYLEDGLLITASGQWAWLRLPTTSVLTERDMLSVLWREERLISGLPGAEGHLLVVPRTCSVLRWARGLDERSRQQAPGFVDHLGRVVGHLRGQGFRDREVYLGLRLQSRQRRHWALRLLAGAEREMGLDDPRPDDKALARLRDEAGLLAREVAGASPGARPATASELRWLVRRAGFRGVLEDAEHEAPPARPAWGGEAMALIEGLVRNGYRSLRVGDDSAGIGHVATLAMAYMPDRLPFPGGEWLWCFEALGFPVEASVRFRVVPPRDSARDLSGLADKALDQYEHVLQSSADLPLDVLETYDDARQLERRVRKENLPLVYCWPRLVVAGASQEELAERVADVVERYRDLGIELVRPSGDQLSLFFEALPGDRLRVGAYEQRMEPLTLAGSLYAASTDLGDGEGPYLGYTTGRARSAVMLDVLAAARQNRPTGVCLIGEQGSGKTNAALKLVHEARLRGAWAVVIAGKQEDVAGLSRMAELAPVQLVRPGDAYEGLLDPFRIEADQEEAALLAAELCMTFLPPRLAREAEALLMAAASLESQGGADGREPSLLGLVGRLQEAESAVAHEVAESLGAVATKPGARMCFGSGLGLELRLEGALTILLLEHLGLPDAGAPREEWSIRERLAVGLVRAMTALAGQLLLSADRHQPKLLFLDEAWAVTGSADGRRLVDRIARISRARNLALLLATQVAGDLTAGDPTNTAIVNSLSVRMGFRSREEREVRSMLALLGVDQSEEMVAQVMGFESGECLLRDLEGRVGRVQVDLVTEELRAAFDTTPRPDEARSREEAS